MYFYGHVNIQIDLFLCYIVLMICYYLMDFKQMQFYSQFFFNFKSILNQLKLKLVYKNDARS